MRLGPWQRRGLVLSLAWPAIASLLYFSQLGVVLRPGEGLPSWVYTWNRITFGDFGFAQFPFHIAVSSACAGCWSPGFNGIAYAIFVVVPVLCLWLTGYYAGWIRKTFVDSAFVPKGTRGRLAAALYVVAIHGLVLLLINGRQERDAGVAEGLLLVLLSFPAGYIVVLLSSLLPPPGPLGFLLGPAFFLMAAGAGYLQWFVGVPWVYRRLKPLAADHQTAVSPRSRAAKVAAAVYAAVPIVLILAAMMGREPHDDPGTAGVAQLTPARPNYAPCFRVAGSGGPAHRG